MNISNWVDLLLEKLNNPDKEKLIRDLLDLGDLSCYGGTFTKMLELTDEYEKKTGDRQYYDEIFENYLNKEGVFLLLKDIIDGEGSITQKLLRVEALFGSVDLEKGDAFVYCKDTLSMATMQELNMLRDDLIYDLIRYEEEEDDAK